MSFHVQYQGLVASLGALEDRNRILINFKFHQKLCPGNKNWQAKGHERIKQTAYYYLIYSFRARSIRFFIFISKTWRLIGSINSWNPWSIAKENRQNFFHVTNFFVENCSASRWNTPSVTFCKREMLLWPPAAIRIRNISFCTRKIFFWDLVCGDTLQEPNC